MQMRKPYGFLMIGIGHLMSDISNEQTGLLMIERDSAGEKTVPSSNACP